MLTGAAMARAGFNRKTAFATTTMVLAAEAADVDVLWEFKGSIAALQHHRGITHSFVGAPFIAAAVLLLVYGLHRIRGNVRRKGKPRLRPRWGFLYLCALIAALSHLWLDYTTAYGIRLFEPFNFRWYSWDLVYIVEPLMLVALIAGLTLPSLFGMINQEIGARNTGAAGRGWAVFALVCLALIWGVRGYEHHRAVTAMNSFLYHEAVPVRAAAYPYVVNPFRWHGVVETANFFETVPVNSLAPDIDLTSGIVFYKPIETPAMKAAKRSYFGRVYLDWAAFPFLRQQTMIAGDNLVNFQDLRYTYPGNERSPLSGFVLLSPDLRVKDEGMNSSRTRAGQSR